MSYEISSESAGHQVYWATFDIPAPLYEIASQCAAVVSETNSHYGQWALRMLNAASELGFTTTDTALVVAEAEIAIPSLVTKLEENRMPQVRYRLRLLQAERDDLSERAQRLGISQRERVQRALRFRNFITKTQGEDRAILFRHKGELVRFL